jgi:hypothetical protein
MKKLDLCEFSMVSFIVDTMENQKLRFLFFLLLFTLVACGKQPARYISVVAYERGEDTEDIVLENNFLELRFLPQTAEIILRDKIRGTEWHSTPEHASADQLANFLISDMMRSQFSLQYTDASGVGEIYYSYSMSIEQGSYEYVIVDGGLEVSYTVGYVPPTYLFPPAAPEERMLVFFERMGTDERRRVEPNYRLYDINNLRSNDDRSALLAKYPDLAHEKMYILRDNTQDFMKVQIEEMFAEAGYTLEDFFEDSERVVEQAAGAVRPAFNITLRYALDGKSLVVTVPFDRIAYRSSYPIIRLDLLPFLGAGGLEDEGYLLVPDGSGALIYFNNGKFNQIAFNSPVYGWDEAMPREAVVNDNKAPFPVFGIQKNGAALLGIIEEGSAYANVQADVSGRDSSYNYVYPYFTMVHGAVMNISGRSDRAVYLFESGLPQDEKITVRYTLCDSDGYVGMAKEYRSWLLKKYPQLANRPAIRSMPIAVEIVSAVNKTQHRLGVPFDLPLKLTSYKEAENMINDFTGYGWNNVSVKLTGWFNHSYDHTVPNRIKLLKELGTKRSFRSLVSTAKQNGYDFYPEADFMFMRDLSLFSGFSLYSDVSRYVNRNRVERYPFSFVWFGERIRWGKLSYLARPETSMNIIDRFMRRASPLGLQNVAFRNMGSRLAGDYNERRHTSREASMKIRQEKFAQLSGNGAKIMVGTGFLYSAPWADFIVDMAVDYQGFSITDASIPFYPIVLHGLVPYTGRAINLAEDYTKNLLKTIESGAGLYFSFMTEETTVLQETKFRQFYANEYHKWVGDADALYKRFSADFAGLYSQAIVDHVILSPGVTVTVYEDGTRVIVNGSDNPWVYEGEGSSVTIGADSYIVRRRGR